MPLEIVHHRPVDATGKLVEDFTARHERFGRQSIGLHDELGPEFRVGVQQQMAQLVSAVEPAACFVVLSRVELTNRLNGRNTWPMATKKELGSFFYQLDPRIAHWWRDAREIRAARAERPRGATARRGAAKMAPDA